MFLTSAPDQYLYNPAFQTKLGFMLLAGCNVFWFYTCGPEVELRPIPGRSPGAQSSLAQFPCLLGALLSSAVG